MKSPNKLDSLTVKMLNARLADEYTAHFFYLNAYNFCKDKGYNKASEFFLAESNAELEHSKILQKFMVDWNVIPNFTNTINTNFEFTSLLEIIEKAYELEYNLFKQYSDNASIILSESPLIFTFIQQFINIQNESVIEYSDLLNATELFNLENKLDIYTFQEEYF